MKKLLLSLSLLCATVQASEPDITLIVTTFKQMSEEQQIRALVSTDPLADWVGQTFPKYTMSPKEYLQIARAIEFKDLIPKVKTYCMERISPVLKQYIQKCEKANTRTCQLIINENEENVIYQGNDVATKELVEEYITHDQFLFFYVATAIHNDLEDLKAVL